MIARGFGSFRSTVRSRCVLSAFKAVGAQRELERARISEAAWGNTEADILR